MVPLQYTGLKDKNGVEIFESDICKYYDDANIEQVGVIKWRECEFYLDALGGDDEGNQDISLHPSEIIFVIGNCWENPELLEAA